MPDLSLEDKVWWASEIRIWGLLATVLVAIISFAATWAQTRFQTALAAQKEIIIKEKERKSEEMIALARKEAAQAKLEQEQLKMLVNWRNISQEDQNNFSMALASRPPHLVALIYLVNDPETMWLAMRLRDAIQNAKWEYGGAPFEYKRNLIFGLFLVGPDNDAKQSLAAALTAANLHFNSIAEFPAGYENSGIVMGAETTILVGSRLPPF